MSSPLSSMHAVNAAHNAYALVIRPHVATAMWAIVLAIACALVMVIAELVKQRNNEEPSDPKRRRRKTPPS